MISYMSPNYDVLIAGGGPAGLSAALALGRARKRVLVCDAGQRRNAAATEIHNFVTRDGTPPDEFRRIAREQLAAYPNVTVQDARIEAITGERGAFRASVSTGTVEARRVLLATGMVDEMLPLAGFRELWGRSIFQCPYCHGWEIRDTRWGYLVLPHSAAHLVPFAVQARGWTSDLVVFTGGAVELTGEQRAALEAVGIRIETARIERLRAGASGLDAIELADGSAVPRDALFVHPPQRQIDMVIALGLTLDDDGYVAVEPMKRETSVPGIYAAGDLTTRGQAAILAAAAGMQAAAAINVELTLELARSGQV